MEELIKRKILIVEDEVSQRKALADKFARDGFTAIEAQDGEEGFAMAIKEQPDLILLDIVMPKMGGLEMLKKLRGENEWGKNVSVVVLSNLSENDVNVVSSIREDKPTCYLVKSNWAINELVEKVKTCLPKQV
ncbi:MAG: response regulator [Candidatus Jorgensenbacteria bacterium]|nr:response regulator [Candidatus Jorgensenbacteria bacterium]